jgi:hypothetical protein
VACLLCVLIIGSGEAAKLRTANVTLAKHGSGNGAELYVAHSLRAWLAEQDAYELIDPLTALDPSSMQQGRRALAEAADQLVLARRAFDELDLDKALVAVELALAGADANVALLTDQGLVVSALTLRAATELLLGKQRPARQTLRALLGIHPQLEIDPSLFNPEMWKVVQQVRESLGGRAALSVSVIASPQHARVYLDGAFVGVTPLELEGVLEGEHYVRLEVDGYVPWGQRISVQSGPPTKVAGTLARPVGHAELLDLLQRAVAEKLPPALQQELATRLQAEVLLLTVVDVQGDKVAVRSGLFDLKSASQRAMGQASFAYDSRPDTYRREMQGVIDQLSKPAAKEMPLDVCPYGADPLGACTSAPVVADGRWRGTLLGVSLGVGSAFLATGGVLWALAGEDNREFRATSQGTSQARELEDSGRAKALMGDIAFGVGALTAITGVLLYTVSGAQPMAQVGSQHLVVGVAGSF